jgi:drug/metabolite transporter (DMT)-like permease
MQSWVYAILQTDLISYAYKIITHKQHKFHWVGVFWNVTSVVIVGATALLATSGSNGNVTSAQTFMGVCLLMAGAFVQSVQFVFEEHVMKMDVPAPPLLLIGMEGFWGTVLGIFVMYPIAYMMPGDDHGSVSSKFTTFVIVDGMKIDSSLEIFLWVLTLFSMRIRLIPGQCS